MRKVTKGNVTIKLWDLGGQPRFRSMWERYCRAVSAIVYGINSLPPCDFGRFFSLSLSLCVSVCVCVRMRTYLRSIAAHIH